MQKMNSILLVNQNLEKEASFFAKLVEKGGMRNEKKTKNRCYMVYYIQCPLWMGDDKSK